MNDITLRHVCKSYTTQSTDIMIDHAQLLPDDVLHARGKIDE